MKIEQTKDGLRWTTGDAVASMAEKTVVSEFYGKVVNCLLAPKDEEEPMFKQFMGPVTFEKGCIVANLDGYAIIQVEEYERLKKGEMK